MNKEVRLSVLIIASSLFGKYILTITSVVIFIYIYKVFSALV